MTERDQQDYGYRGGKLDKGAKTPPPPDPGIVNTAPPPQKSEGQQPDSKE